MKRITHRREPESRYGDAPTFGLPPCLQVPIAAASLEAIEQYVGPIVKTIAGRNGYANALLVAHESISWSVRSPISLWSLPEAKAYWAQVHANCQLWVHVDYARYRQAWITLNMPPIAADTILDHIQNRKAVRIRGYSHPYLRLCPISRRTNSNAGGQAGSEGLERAYIGALGELSPEWQAEIARILAIPIQLADPADLTKMLDVSPGPHTLCGTRDFQKYFYV